MKLRSRFSALIVAIALPALVCPAMSYAGPKPASSTGSADQGSSVQTFSVNGRISSVDYIANSIVVQGKHGPVTVSLTPTTSVDLTGEQGGISDLRPGMHVRIRGTVIGGVMTAESIVIVH